MSEQRTRHGSLSRYGAQWLLELLEAERAAAGSNPDYDHDGAADLAAWLRTRAAEARHE